MRRVRLQLLLAVSVTLAEETFDRYRCSGQLQLVVPDEGYCVVFVEGM